MKITKIITAFAGLITFALLCLAAPGDPKNVTVTITQGEYDVLKKAAKRATKQYGTNVTAEQYGAILLSIDLAQAASQINADEAEKVNKKLSNADTNTVQQVKTLLGISDDP